MYPRFTNHVFAVEFKDCMCNLLAHSNKNQSKCALPMHLPLLLSMAFQALRAIVAQPCQCDSREHPSRGNEMSFGGSATEMPFLGCNLERVPAYRLKLIYEVNYAIRSGIFGVIV
jgi:hypothetical protein